MSFTLQKFHSMSIAKKLGLFTFSAVFGVILLTALFLMSERKLMMEERQNNVRQAVETAYGLLTNYHNLATSGALTEEVAKQRALQAVRNLRYSSTEYFWVNDMQPRMLMHPISPELEGKDLSEKTDPTGKRIAFICRSTDARTGRAAAAADKPCWTEPPARTIA